MCSPSLNNHPREYHLSASDCLLSVLTLSSITYAKRHYELSKKSHGHGCLIVLNALPVIGLITGLCERIFSKNPNTSKKVASRPRNYALKANFNEEIPKSFSGETKQKINVNNLFVITDPALLGEQFDLNSFHTRLVGDSTENSKVVIHRNSLIENEIKQNPPIENQVETVAKNVLTSGNTPVLHIEIPVSNELLVRGVPYDPVMLAAKLNKRFNSAIIHEAVMQGNVTTETDEYFNMVRDGLSTPSNNKSPLSCNIDQITPSFEFPVRMVSNNINNQSHEDLNAQVSHSDSTQSPHFHTSSNRTRRLVRGEITNLSQIEQNSHQSSFHLHRSSPLSFLSGETTVDTTHVVDIPVNFDHLES